MGGVVISQDLGNSLCGGVNLLSQDLLLFPEGVYSKGSQFHLRAKLLLSMSRIRHPGEDEIETLHDLLPVSIILTRSLLHGVEHELSLRGRLGRRRGARTANRPERERNYGQ